MLQGIPHGEFEKVIFENQALIISVCNVYKSSQTDRDDLFQEIVLNLWKGRDSFKGNAKLSTWIYRVSLNTAISKTRKRKRNPVFYTDSIPEMPQTGEESAVMDHRLKALYHGISKLKPIEKAIVLLYLEEKTYEEIAEIIGISKTNVSVRLVRLKRKLEKMMKISMAGNT